MFNGNASPPQRGHEMKRKQRELWAQWEREQLERPRTAPPKRHPRTVKTFWCETTHRYETLIVLERIMEWGTNEPRKQREREWGTK